MVLRVLLGFLAIAVVGASGQGPVPVKAGDPAPNLVWTRILSPAGPASQTPASLFGHVTVLAFLPNVTANEELVSSWNRLVGKFANQPVQFVWITSGKVESLGPWVEKHPVSGWLLLDSDGATAREYGIDVTDGVLVDTNGKIAGFTFMLPEERQIQAVQEGRAVAMTGDADDKQLEAIMAGRIVRLNAEPHRFPAPQPKPNFPPSYDVHISPSSTRGTDSSSGPDFWVERGYDLRAIISKAFETEPNRIILSSSLDTNKRYDFVLVPPREEDPQTMHHLLQQGIEKYFHVSVAPEKRPVDVYVMTALEGKTPKAKPEAGFVGGSSISWSSREITFPQDRPPTIEELRKAASEMPVGAISEISASDTTVDDFRRALEQGLNRPIIDETNLKGTYDLVVHGNGRTTEEFLHQLRDQLGLVLTPAVRTIDMLVVEPRR